MQPFQQPETVPAGSESRQRSEGRLIMAAQIDTQHLICAIAVRVLDDTANLAGLSNAV